MKLCITLVLILCLSGCGQTPNQVSNAVHGKVLWDREGNAYFATREAGPFAIRVVLQRNPDADRQQCEVQP